MIVMTMTSSTSVKPRERRAARWPPLAFLAVRICFSFNRGSLGRLTPRGRALAARRLLRRSIRRNPRVLAARAAHAERAGPTRRAATRTGSLRTPDRPAIQGTRDRGRRARRRSRRSCSVISARVARTFDDSRSRWLQRPRSPRRRTRRAGLASARAHEERAQAAPPLPREKDLRLVCRLPRTGPPRHCCMKSFIWMNGIRIANAMNPTVPPMKTIMSGSSKLVSAETRVSTCAS